MWDLPDEGLDGKPCPRLPKKDEIDMLVGGPSCQGVSRNNIFPKADDIRVSHIAVFLAFVEHYQPRYVLLENVEGLVHYKVSPDCISFSNSLCLMG